jgi:hypothetical protein
MHFIEYPCFKIPFNNVKNDVGGSSLKFNCLPYFFSNGVRLQPEDEKFILEKVLENHPEKQSKVSGEIDYIMVWFLNVTFGFYIFTM